MKASDLLVEALEAEGVRYVFGVPGEENLDLLESLRCSSIEFVVSRHEQAAGFMAATWGRLTGTPGVVLTTLGPGATNLTTAISYAFLGGMPLVCITGQKPIKKSKQGRFQILDIVRMMEPITKLSKQVVDANNLPHLVRESFRVAQNEKPGPVHLELPEDIAREEVDRVPFTVTEVQPAVASRPALDEAADMLMRAERPLVCIASGANRSKSFGVLQDFIDGTGLYFVTTQMGKGAIDERHPRFLGTTALSSGDYTHDALDAADVVLMIGHDLSEKPPFFMERGGKRVIHMNEDAAGMDDVYFPQLEVLGCTATNIKALSELVHAADSWDSKTFERVRADWRHERARGRRARDVPARPTARRSRDPQRAAERRDRVARQRHVQDLVCAQLPGAHPQYASARQRPGRMGAGLPAAIGAKLVYPERQAVAVCGDGGFMMSSQELETAVRLSST